jgi:hypothetical protein
MQICRVSGTSWIKEEHYIYHDRNQEPPRNKRTWGEKEEKPGADVWTGRCFDISKIFFF